MCVHADARRAEAFREYEIRGLSPHARKGQERAQVARDASAVLLQEDLGDGLERARLGPVEAHGADGGLDAREGKVEKAARRGRQGPEAFEGLLRHHVAGAEGEHGAHEHGEGVGAGSPDAPHHGVLAAVFPLLHRRQKPGEGPDTHSLSGADLRRLGLDHGASGGNSEW